MGLFFFSSDLPSIQCGYSDSQDTICRVHSSPACVYTRFVPLVFSEEGRCVSSVGINFLYAFGRRFIFRGGTASPSVEMCSPPWCLPSEELVLFRLGILSE